MNKIYIHGRLVRDPSTKEVGQSSVCNFTVASDRAFKNAQGERETDFFDVQAWGKLGELVQSHWTKGKEIIVHGEIQSRKYQDRDGNNRTAWQVRADSVEFCGSKSDASGQGGYHPPKDDGFGIPDEQPDEQPDGAGDFEPLDDEQVPF